MGLFRKLFGSKDKSPSASGPSNDSGQAATSGPPSGTWKVVNPQISCKRPLDRLRRVFVFCSGDAREIGATALSGYVQDAAEAPLAEIIGKAGGMELVSHSSVESEISVTGKIPQSAVDSMAIVAPDLLRQHYEGSIRMCVRTLDDPESGQSAAIFLLYEDP